MSLVLPVQLVNDWLGTQQPDMPTADAYADALTVHGLEATVLAVEPPFDGVVTGQIQSVSQHPNADRLNVCTVDIQSKLLTIVCGCSSVRPGLVVAVALVGCQLPGLKIKKSKIRGVVSEGMLCSPKELGFGFAYDTIWHLDPTTPLGLDFSALLQTQQTHLELDITPNRGDWLSARGVARELSLVHSLPVDWREKPANVELCQWDGFPVDIHDKQGCQHYSLVSLSGFRSDYTTVPLWLIERMRQCQINMVHPIVDILNYVAVEYGQPMHAFDRDQLTGSIHVRNARQGESLRLLNHEMCELNEDVLIIADAAKPVALAGVMGGLDSSVTESTQTILIESAHFSPARIARACRRYRLASDAGYRFERGVDTHIAEKALLRAIELIQLCFPSASVTDIQTSRSDHQPCRIELKQQLITDYLGYELTTSHIHRCLTSVATIKPQADGKSWLVEQPSHRFDLISEVNWVSEVIRVSGYDTLKSCQPNLPISLDPSRLDWATPFTCSHFLKSLGYVESLSFSFVDGASQERIWNSQDHAVKLLNPLSQAGDVLRQTLSLGLLKSAQHNIQRQKHTFKMFEWGNVYAKNQADELVEKRLIAGICVGKTSAQNWCVSVKDIDYFDIKSHVVSLFSMFDLSSQLEFEVSDHSLYHPYQQANVLIDGVTLGHLGMIHPEVARQFDLPLCVGLFEIDYSHLRQKQFKHVNQASKFPSVRRDLSFWISADVDFGSIKKTIDSLDINTFKSIDLTDVYCSQGDGDDNRVSFTIALYFQHTEKTLSERDVNRYLQGIVSCLETHFNIELRGEINGNCYKS
ncbi:MAG: phenylalanine--tRNA ligase subunit beta [Legionellales bacterium]|nr:phenylalanine--tRNA ligase subunit beta [Legionellales bacterium]